MEKKALIRWHDWAWLPKWMKIYQVVIGILSCIIGYRVFFKEEIPKWPSIIFLVLFTGYLIFYRIELVKRLKKNNGEL